MNYIHLIIIMQRDTSYSRVAENDNAIDDRLPFNINQSEASSSLPVQISLYYNVMFSVVFFLLEGSLVLLKVPGIEYFRYYPVKLLISLIYQVPKFTGANWRTSLFTILINFASMHSH